MAALRSRTMIGSGESGRDLAMIRVPPAGALLATGDPWEPYRLVDPDGEKVQPVADYLNDLQAAGRAAATQRSYGMDLLRWFRFLLCTCQGQGVAAVALWGRGGLGRGTMDGGGRLRASASACPTAA